MAKVEITDELLDKYKKHPRMVEVKFIMFFDLLEREYGYEGARKIIAAFCTAFNRNMDVLDVVINKRFDIKRKSKTNKTRWIQEVVFLGTCYKEKPYTIAKYYLNTSPSNFYRHSMSKSYDTDQFLTDEWLRNLDDEVQVTGNIIYRNEVKAIVEILESFKRVLDMWGLTEKRGGE